jgi:glyoxylate reductase
MMRITPHILFFSPVRHAVQEYQHLSSIAKTQVISSKSRAEFFNDVKSKYNDITAIYSTSSSYAASPPPNSSRLFLNPARLPVNLIKN